MIFRPAFAVQVVRYGRVVDGAKKLRNFSHKGCDPSVWFADAKDRVRRSARVYEIDFISSAYHRAQIAG